MDLKVLIWISKGTFVVMDSKEACRLLKNYWRLILCRFEQIRAQVGGRVRLVLHGTNGFAPELMKKCIAAGVSKINVNRLVLDDYYTHLRSKVSNMTHTNLMEEGVKKVINQTIEWMEVCGSAGKA